MFGLKPVRLLMRIAHDIRARPILWLVCAAFTSVVCFWLPYVFSYPPFSNQEYIPREWIAFRFVCSPFAILSTIAGFRFYLSLWRKTWRHPDTLSRWLLAVGSMLFLVAVSPLPVFVILGIAQSLLYG